MADTGGNLDKYLYRKDLPNGRYTFNIDITRYYSSFIDDSAIDPATSFLKTDVYRKLVVRKLLPETAELLLKVYDVDHDNQTCPEVDHIYLNEQQLKDSSGAVARLSSGNNTWSTWKITVPTSILRFPTSPGSGGQAPKMTNTVAIDVNVSQCKTGPNSTTEAWAVQIDWGALLIKGSIRPVIFIPGLGGQVEAFRAGDNFEQFLKSNGIPYATPSSFPQGTIDTEAAQVASLIAEHTKNFGVLKVNVFGYSRGGLVSRIALHAPATASMVDALVSFGGPQHGISGAWLLDKKKAEMSVDNLRRRYNYGENCRQALQLDNPISFTYKTIWVNCLPPVFRKATGVRYFSFAEGANDSRLFNLLTIVSPKEATYPWDADAVPFPTKPNVNAVFNGLNHSDIIRTRSVHCAALQLVDASVYSVSTCKGASQELQLTALPPAEVVLAEPELQTITASQDALIAGQTFNLNVKVDAVARALFVLSTGAPATFTLQDPAGRAITPSLAATAPDIRYEVMQDLTEPGIWTYMYEITSPQAGSWKSTTSAQSATKFTVTALAPSATYVAHTMPKFTYTPGEQVSVEATLLNGANALPNATFSGVIVNGSDTPQAVTFSDDGLNGDSQAGDRLYTASFNAPTAEGLYTLNIYASTAALTRFSPTTFAVGAPVARFNRVSSVTRRDLNSNGLYDTLDVRTSINITTQTHLRVEGVLVDQNGQVIDVATYSTRTSTGQPLSAGQRVIDLSFDGNAIRQHGADGPYKLAILRIYAGAALELLVDTVTDATTTSSTYKAREFEGPVFRIVSGSARGVDTDANGLYNQLVFALKLDVSLAATYNWNGQLVDQQGREIGWASGRGTLNADNELILTFDGRQIGNQGYDGPYILQSLTINRSSSSDGLSYFSQAYTTSPLRYIQFEQDIRRVYLPLIAR